MKSTNKENKMIYLVGSLRNERIPIIDNRLTAEGFEVFSDWYSPGPKADDHWKDYEKARGKTYLQALDGWAAKHIFEFDLYHLKRADTAVLVAPAGRSGHLELGWALGQGKKGYILLESELDRWDIMLKFATGIFTRIEDLIYALKKDAKESD